MNRRLFPDGVIGLRVDGKDNDIIAREFARNIGEIIEPDDERDAPSIMQSIFGGREALLIFDNAENASLRALIPGGRSSVIITTRDRGLPILLEVPAAARVDVPALAEDRGTELLRRRLGDRVDSEIDSAGRIVGLVGGLPLALQIVASLLESHHGDHSLRSQIFSRMRGNSCLHSRSVVTYTWMFVCPSMRV